MADIHESPERRAALEALLFHYGEPVTLKKIASILRIKEAEASTLALALRETLAADATRGLMVLRNGDEVQLVTKPEFKDVGERIVEEEFREELTPAALETLSLIAYLGPVSRPTVDYVRGVNSSYTVRNLMMRGLIERFQEAEKGHAYSYRVSFDFLKHMGLSDARELPEYETYRGILAKFEAQEREAQETAKAFPGNAVPAGTEPSGPSDAAPEKH